MNENIVVRIGADISQLSSQLGQAKRDLGSFGDGMKNVGASMATSFGAATLAIGAGLGFAVKKAADFDTQIRKAGAIAGASTEELDKMKQSALELGATTSQSASSTAAAMTELAAKGMSANEVIAAMPGIISAAEASGEDLALAADTVSSALNIWGFEASESSRIADVLTESANSSAAGIDSLGYVLKYAGAPAAALGISLEEVAAAAGIMTDAGLDGSNAGTSLRASLLALNSPATAQSKIMEKLGISTKNSKNETKSLSEIVDNVTKSMEGMTEAEKVATLSKLVGTEAVSGFLQLMKAGPSVIDKNTEALRNSAGASAEAAAKMKAGIGGALENLSGAFESLAITIGDQLVPIVTAVAKFLTKLAEKFMSLSDGVKKFLVIGTLIAGIFTAIAAGIGVLLMVVGGAITGLTAIAGALGIAGGAAGLLGAAFTLLTGPIGIAIAAIVGIGAILVLAYNKVGWFRDAVNTAWTAIKNATLVAFNAVKSVIVKVMAEVMVFVGQILGKLKAFWAEHGASITKLVSGSFNAVLSVIKSVMGYIQGIFQAVWPIISGAVQIAWALIKTIVSSSLDIILGIVGAVMNVLEGDWRGAWNSIKQIVVDVWGNIKSYLGSIDLASIGRNIMQGLVRGISSMSGAVKDTVKGIANAIPSGVKKLLGIHSPSRVMMALGEFVGQGLAKGVTGTAKQVASAGKSLASKLNSAIANKTTGKGLDSALASVRTYASKQIAILGSIAKNREAISGKLKVANDKLAEAMKVRNDFAKSVTDGALSFASIGNVDAKTGDDFAMQLRERLHSITEFQANIKRLQKAGLNKTALQDIINAGVEGGGAKAAILAGATSEAIKDINSTQTKINAASKALGKDAADQFFGAGVMAAQGIAKGLASQAKALELSANKISDALVKAVKRRLDIHSPSRVLAEIGKFTGLGLIKGLDGQMSSVERMGQSLANAAVAKPTLSYATPSGASYSSLSSALSGSVDVSTTEQSGLLREIVSAIREGQVLTIDGRRAGGTLAPHVKAKNDMVTAFRRNGNGGGVYGV